MEGMTTGAVDTGSCAATECDAGSAELVGWNKLYFVVSKCRIPRNIAHVAGSNTTATGAAMRTVSAVGAGIPVVASSRNTTSEFES